MYDLLNQRDSSNHAKFYIVLLKKQECALIHMQGFNVKIGIQCLDFY